MIDRRIVVGDIHGCILTFRKLVEDELKLKKSDILFLPGDYIDRGPDSKAVVDYIMWLKNESYQIITLMGNHEYMLLQAMESMEYYKLWMLNSGVTTLRDFGIDVAANPGPEAIFRIPNAYLEFFRNLGYYAETPGYFISHGCFDGRTENPLNDISSMIWNRVESYNADFLCGRKLIHGHIPMAIEEIRSRINDPATLIINIDAGCVYRNNARLGYLAAFDLDSRDFFALKNCE